MPTRKRIRNPGGQITGTGGGVVVNSGTLNWGPQFGRSDQVSAEVAGTFSLDDLQVEGIATGTYVSFDLFSVDPTLNAGAAGGLDLLDITLFGASHIRPQTEVDGQFWITYEQNAATTVDLTALDLVYDAGASSGIDVAAVDLDTTQDVLNRLNDVYVSTNEARPREDTFWEENNPNNTNDSASTLLARRSDDLQNAARHAYLLWDLTGFGGLQVVGGRTSIAAKLSMRLGQLVGGADVDIEVYAHASQPFGFGATWNSAEPPPGTLITTLTASDVSAGSWVTYNFDLTNFWTQIRGKWMYFRCTGIPGLNSSTNVEIGSKDVSNSGERPWLQITEAKIG